MSISVYISAFNIENGLFDWKKSLDRLLKFGDELVIGTTDDSKDNTINLLQEYTKDNYYSNIKLVITSFKLDSPTFDGDIKNAALLQCSNKYRCLFDLDEFPILLQKPLWLELCDYMEHYDNQIDGFLIPSINLCGDVYHYKDINFKFYLHNDKIRRGVVNYAKLNNNAIDITKSDTCDAILEDGNLGRFLRFSNDINDLRGGRIPYVFHEWAIDFDKRIGQNKFWSPVWSSRAGKEVLDIILEKEKLKNIEIFPHGLII